MSDGAERIGQTLLGAGLTLAVAESLTGGLLANRFAAAEDAAEWFRGGVVAYQKHVKFSVLDVPEGPVVTEEAAVAMARGAARALDADVALAVTGAGGPDPQDGQPPGTVWAAALTADGTLLTREHHFEGDPPEVCDQAASAAVALLWQALTAPYTRGVAEVDTG